MKLGIIAGNRYLPLLLAQRIKEQNPNLEVIAICFKGETSPSIVNFVDKVYWINVGELAEFKKILEGEGLTQCVMVGQINPLRIFDKRGWDQELMALVQQTKDFRAHTIFSQIINYLQDKGVKFLDSTTYLKDDLADEGLMNQVELNQDVVKDIDFGLKIVSEFVELDVGQTIVVKSLSAVALESLEGTDKTVKRGYKLAGKGCCVLKFSKVNQDLRFDVPVVGLSTLRLLKRIKVSALVLEKNKVIILRKKRFLELAKKYRIPIIGSSKV